jgi:hypothetical protein
VLIKLGPHTFSQICGEKLCFLGLAKTFSVIDVELTKRFVGAAEVQFSLAVGPSNISLTVT